MLKKISKKISYEHFPNKIDNAPETNMSIFRKEDNEFGFFYSRRIEHKNNFIGVIFIEVNLKKFEKAWIENGEAVIITDSMGKIILSTEPRWKGLTEEQAFKIKKPENSLKRVYYATSQWAKLKEADFHPNAQAAMRFSEKIPLLNLNISSFINYSSVREKVNTILAFRNPSSSIFDCFSLYLLNRKNTVRLNLFEEETLQLKELNKRLTEEIKQRKRVEKNLWLLRKL